ncbi:MAG: hypothetical protein R3D70_22665 [Rhizobiaceae bacterium]|jgi:hypothetical protein
MFQWTKSCSYDDEQKRRFHSTARSRLKKLTAELRLGNGTYEIRSNKAGIAVSGEITLHHDRFYLQVGQFGLSSGHGILIRTCKGRKDYTSGPNHFVGLHLLDDIPALAAAVHAITGVVAAEPIAIDDRLSLHRSKYAPTEIQGSRRRYAAAGRVEDRP